MTHLRCLLPTPRNNFTKWRSMSTRAERRKKVSTELLNFFPEKLFNKKSKTPSNLYLTAEQGATIINASLKPFLKELAPECKTAIELNPGIGLFTQKLLQLGRFKEIVLMEPMESFLPRLQQLQDLQPNRVTLQHGDMVNMWKLAYQDKIDNGTRIAELLQHVPKSAYDSEPKVAIFGATGSYPFLKHLMNSLVFQNSLHNWGRYEMFLIMPPPIYIHLTCRHDMGLMFYRSSSILFQMFFEYRFIARVPRQYFLPAQATYNGKASSKLYKIKTIDPEYLYLVKIVPRRNIYDLCPAADMPALWYFVKQNCISRRNRIIPNLEKWVPGCGPRLIINHRKTVPAQQLYPDVNKDDLPQFSYPCSTLNAEDYYPHINIYTQFGDLSPNQMLTLFCQFRKWPEYAESSFLASLESSLLKIETTADESIDSLGLVEDDDGGNEDMHLEDAEAEGEISQIDETNNKINPTKKRTKSKIHS